MRKNIEAVLVAFSQHRSKDVGSCWTDGRSVFSYGTKIAGYDDEGFIVVVDKDSTKTTNTQIKACLQFFAPASVKRAPNL